LKGNNQLAKTNPLIAGLTLYSKTKSILPFFHSIFCYWLITVMCQLTPTHPPIKTFISRKKSLHGFRLPFSTMDNIGANKFQNAINHTFHYRRDGIFTDYF